MRLKAYNLILPAISVQNNSRENSGYRLEQARKGRI
jgi:hypothetical protein